METQALEMVNKMYGNESNSNNPHEFDYTDYSKAKLCFKRLIDNWRDIVSNTEINRAKRYIVDCESEKLRAQGILKADEIYNTVRIIDTNIRREQPKYLNYFVGSRRALVLSSQEETHPEGVDKLEILFTKVARYDGYEIPFIRCFDGGQTHGWDFVEILFNQDKPGHFEFEHVGRDKLIFDIESHDIQKQELILKVEELTGSQLKSFVRLGGWNKEQVDKLLSETDKKSENGEEVKVCIYKCFWKTSEGNIKFSYYSDKGDDYLAPIKDLFLGIRDVNGGKKIINQEEINKGLESGMMVEPILDYPKVVETQFPFFGFKYVESENPVITDLKGRADLDESVQEGAGALTSALINGTVRASHIMGSPRPTQLNTFPNAAPKQINVTVRSGLIWDQPMDWDHLPYPDAGSITKAFQTIVGQNQQEQSSVDYLATNRKDTNKTATEIQSAQSLASELSSVQVINTSIFLRAAYGKAWLIYQSRVLQGKIKVAPTALQYFGDIKYKETNIDGEIRIENDPLTQEPIIVSITPKVFIVKSSGDVDVIQRDEMLQRYMQAWPVISNSGIAEEFFRDYLRLAFPQDVERYIKVLDDKKVEYTEQLKTMLMQTANVLKTSLGSNPEASNENMGQIQQLFQQIQGLLQQGQTPVK